MKSHCNFKPKKKINYNRANLKRIRNFQSSSLCPDKPKRVPIEFTMSLLPIPKFLDPMRVYKLPGDLLLEDKIIPQCSTDKFCGSMNDYRHFKKIVSMSYDLKFETLSVNMMNFDDEYSSSDLLISRLRTLGKESAKNLSDFIEEYMKMSQFNTGGKVMNGSPNNKDKYKVFTKKKQEVQMSLNNEEALFLISDFSITKNGITQLNKFSFSKELINILFDSIEEAMHFINKEGFPEYLSFYKEYYDQFLHCLKRIFYRQREEQIYSRLITKNNEAFLVKSEFIQEFYVEENYVEGYLIHLLIPLEPISRQKVGTNMRYMVSDKTLGQKYLVENIQKMKKPSSEEKDAEEKKRCHYKQIK